MLRTTLSNKLLVLLGGFLGGSTASTLLVLDALLVHEGSGGDKTLDLGGLGVGLAVLDNLAADDVLADIIFGGKVEELSNVGSTLGTETLGGLGVGKALDLGVALLDDNKGDDRKIGTSNATTNGLALALAGSAGTVARVALREKEADTGGVENTLLHGETLLVVTTGDLENVALELIANGVALDFLAHALLVKNADAVLVVDFKELLSAVGRVRNVQLDGKG